MHVLMVSLLTNSSVDVIHLLTNNRSLNYIVVTARMEEPVLRRTVRVRSSVDADPTSKETIVLNTFPGVELVPLAQDIIPSSRSSLSSLSLFLGQLS